SGMNLVTLSSNRSFPSSTSMASPADVIAFVVDPIANRVCSSARAGLPTSSTPYPFAKTSESSFTTAIASAGTCQSRAACATYLSNAAQSGDLLVCADADAARPARSNAAPTDALFRIGRHHWELDV